MINQEIAERLIEALKDGLQSKLGAGRRRDYYGVYAEVIAIDALRAQFDLVLTFRRGEHYCCAESGCHFGLWEHKNSWENLRNRLDARDHCQLPTMTMRKMRVVIEAGAWFDHGGAVDSESSYEIGPFDEANAAVWP